MPLLFEFPNCTSEITLPVRVQNLSRLPIPLLFDAERGHGADDQTRREDQATKRHDVIVLQFTVRVCLARSPP